MPSSITQWKLYVTPPDAVQAMYRACESAERTIDFEQYIFEDNEQGRSIMALLEKKATEGVRVRFLCDGSGSFGLVGSMTLDRAVRAGVQVVVFNPIKPWMPQRIFKWFLRDHRKLLIVDGSCALLGGVNVRMYTKERRDAHVSVCGPVVAQCLAAFNRMWEMAAAGKRIFRFERPQETEDGFSLITNAPHRRQRFTYWELVRRFRGARKYIYVATPYFIPDRRIFRALKGAARRGVLVTLLLPASPDWRLVRFGNSSFYARALRAGIRIFEFGPHFNHEKTYMVDGEWASVGSSNIDSLSLLFNYEIDLISRKKEFIHELESQFHADVSASKEITLRMWRMRPLLHKLCEQLVRPLHRFM